MLKDMIVDHLGGKGYKIYNCARDSFLRGAVVVGSGGNSWKRTTHTIIVYFNNKWLMDITCEDAKVEIRYPTGFVPLTHKIDFHNPDAFDQLDEMLCQISST